MLRFISLLMLAFLLQACSGGDERTDAEREAFRQELIEKALNDEVRKAGDAFLAENRSREGVQETPSGMQYRVIQAAEGTRPRADQTVEVFYEGRRIDGEVFERTSEDKPAVLAVNRVIRGWREALMQMSEGAIWELYLPPELAYGATSPNEMIPANSTLIFRIELRRILNSEQETP